MRGEDWVFVGFYAAVGAAYMIMKIINIYSDLKLKEAQFEYAKSGVEIGHFMTRKLASLVATTQMTGGSVTVTVSAEMAEALFAAEDRMTRMMKTLGIEPYEPAP